MTSYVLYTTIITYNIHSQKTEHHNQVLTIIVGDLRRLLRRKAKMKKQENHKALLNDFLLHAR